ncbi:MAG: tyrosine-type recombinase/integrase [Haloferacaceae archaeon]
MRRRDYDDADGKRVWLSQNELDDLLDEPDDTLRSVALALAGRCGLRRHEVVGVTPADLVDGPTGTHVRVEGKGGHYREPPVPSDLQTKIGAYVDVADVEHDAPIVDRDPKTVERWVISAAEARREDTDDVGWADVRPHDLRRSWGTLLLEHGVEPGMVMEWGGWRDWQTFRESYLGEFSPEAVRREREKLPWE